MTTWTCGLSQHGSWPSYACTCPAKHYGHWEQLGYWHRPQPVLAETHGQPCHMRVQISDQATSTYTACWPMVGTVRACMFWSREKSNHHGSALKLMRMRSTHERAQDTDLIGQSLADWLTSNKFLLLCWLDWVWMDFVSIQIGLSYLISYLVCLQDLTWIWLTVNLVRSQIWLIK